MELGRGQTPYGDAARIRFLRSSIFRTCGSLFDKPPCYCDNRPLVSFAFRIDVAGKRGKTTFVWARWAKVPENPLSVDPSTIAENRDAWLTTWGEITTR